MRVDELSTDDETVVASEPDCVAVQPVLSDCVDAVGTGVAVPPSTSKVASKKVPISWAVLRLQTTLLHR